MLLTVGGYLYFQESKSVLVERIKRDIEVSLSEEVIIISKIMDIKVKYLESLSKNSLLINSLVDPSTRDSSLQLFMRDAQVAGYADSFVAVANFEGRVLAANTDITKNYVDAPWLQRVMTGKLHTETFMDNGLAKFFQVVPIFYNGFAEGLVASEIYLDFSDFLSVSTIEDVSTFVYDPVQKIVIYGDSQQFYQYFPMQQKLAADTESILEDGQLVKFHRRYQNGPINVNWLIIKVFNKQGLLQDLAKNRNKYLIVLGLLIFGVFMLAYILSRTLTDPIARLDRVARSIMDRGLNVDVPTDIQGGNDEVGRLSRTFQEMHYQLNESYQTLEKRVRERTAELEVSTKLLKASQERIQVATQVGRIGVWDYDLEKDVLIWDDVMYELYGVNRDEFLGNFEAWKIHVHPDDLDPSVKAVEAAIAGTQDLNIEFRVIWPKDQSVHYIRARALVFRDEEGRPYRLLGSNWDVTEARMLERETQMILNNVPAYIFYKDNNNRIIRLNESAAKFMGHTVEEVQGKSTEEFFDAQMAKKYFQDDLEVFESQKPKLDIVEEMKLDTGKSLWIKTDKIPIRNDDGKFDSILVVATDISEIKRYQSELERSNKELEQFAYVASHDLQEPIRKIVGFSQLLESEMEGELDATCKEYMHYVVDGAKRMQILIKDLLEYSRVGSAEINLQEVDFNAIIDEFKDNFQLKPDSEEVSINVTDLPVVWAHRSFMLRLIQNLIGNALKYRSHESPVIEISAEQVADEWEFTVSDNGIGMNMEFAERIFVIFQRLHTKDKYQGTGIGLSICKQMVERHGGRIWLHEAEAGKGSTFKFTLPIQPQINGAV